MRSFLNYMGSRGKKVWDFIREQPVPIDRYHMMNHYGLTRNQYEAIFLFYMMHKSHSDIAYILGISESASRMVLHRAVLNLKHKVVHMFRR